MIRRAIVVLALCLAACFDPHPPDGALHCSPKGECPSGYVCINLACWDRAALDMKAND